MNSIRTLVSATFFGLTICALVGCATPASSLYRNNPHARPVSEKKAMALAKRVPKNATLLEMEQAFRVIRHAKTPEDLRRARDLLARSLDAFEDLTDPENLSLAFTPDDSVPYKGRPHERVMAALTLGALDAAAGRCDMALPALKTAEFLDARWQVVPYGTDAPLVYALMVHCLEKTKSAPADIERARRGLRLSIRMKIAQPALLRLLSDAARAVPRYESMGARLSWALMEMGIPAALLNAHQANSAEELVGASADEAARALSQLEEAIERKSFQKVLKQTAQVMDKGMVVNKLAIRDQIHSTVGPALQEMKEWMLHASAQLHAGDVQAALDRADELTERVEAAMAEDSVVLEFAGVGPTMRGEGGYGEILVIESSQSGSAQSKIRSMGPRSRARAPGCGILKGRQTSALLQFCAQDSALQKGSQQGIELFSSSYQATTVIGRKFDRVLRSRAQFKSVTDELIVVGAFSGFFLFLMAAEVMASCDGDTAACMGLAGAILAAAIITVGVTFIIWAVGAAVNPKADLRHVTSLFESGILWLKEEEFHAVE